MADTLDNQNNTAKTVPTWVWVVVGVFLLLLIIGIPFGIYFTVKRYQLIGQAISSGQSGTAAALAAPEIGRGIGYGISGLGSLFRRQK